jgi:hypothetical protein
MKPAALLSATHTCVTDGQLPPHVSGNFIVYQKQACRTFFKDLFNPSYNLRFRRSLLQRFLEYTTSFQQALLEASTKSIHFHNPHSES